MTIYNWKQLQEQSQSSLELYFNKMEQEGSDDYMYAGKVL